jgi:ABC-type cobalamin/Fe3+-siderophores transport system ATPase subunit
MKINSIKVSNFCGLRELDLTLVAPVTIVAGRNGSGKTSLVEGIRMAIGGESGRVKLKKDYAQMVTDGAKKGAFFVAFDGGESLLTLPNGAVIAQGKDELKGSEFLPYVLNQDMFINLNANERRTFLFKLSGCKLTADLLEKKLINRGCKSEKVAMILAVIPCLSGGIDAESKSAKDKAAESRGAWKAVTGETYGEVKAVDWKAPEIDISHLGSLDDLQANIITWQGHVDRINQELGQHNAAHAALGETNARISLVHSRANSYARVKQKLEMDKAELANWQGKLNAVKNAVSAKAVMPCPCCKTHLVVGDGVLVETFASAKPVDVDVSKLAEYQKAVDLYTSSVANDQRDLTAVELAIEEVKTIGDVQTVEQVQTKITDARTALAHAQSEAKKFHDKAVTLQLVQHKANEAATATDNAAGYHADVIEWMKISDALAPDGIPAEILASALQPFNDRLRESATTTKWMQVAIDSNMSITANGREYALLCESEKWRVSAMIAEAISFMSGLKIIALDRMDVIDIPSRAELMKWLNTLASSKAIDTAIVCATLKISPKLPANFQSIWLENGVISTEAIAA